VSIQKLSPFATVRTHFGRSNVELSVMHQVPLDNDNFTCIEIRSAGGQSKYNSSFVLFDDSYSTSYLNTCGREVKWLRVDFQHPHYKGELP